MRKERERGVREGGRGKEKGGEETEGTYPKTLLSTQQSASVHPTAVSPRRLRQLRTRSGEKCLPAASAVKRIRDVATV